VQAWRRNPAVAEGGDRRVVIHCLRQELLGMEVDLDATVCSPKDHGEHEHRRLVAAAGSLMEVVQQRMKSPAVLIEENPHPLDEARLQVARGVGVRDQSLASLCVVRLLQRPAQVEAAANQGRAAHHVSHERACPPEVA